MNDRARQDRTVLALPDRSEPVRIGTSSLGAAMIVGLGADVVVVAALLPFRSELNRAGPALLLVVPVVAAALFGGRVAAVVTAIASALALNLAFIPPFWTLKVTAIEDVIALVVFLVVAAVIGTLVADAADRRRAAEQRSRELEELYARVEALADERARLAEEAAREAARLEVFEKVDQQRSALMSSVSHDLRTPLSIIRAAASDLRSEVDYTPDAQADLLQTIEDEAERLDRLVANVLSMSRIEAGAVSLDLQAVDARELVQLVARRLSRLLDHVRFQVDIADDLPLIDGDYPLVDQAVTNLLENAARHAPAGSMIRVAGRALESMVELRVIDEGIGVSDHQRERIFEPFRRGEGSLSSGVGLAICKAVARAHHGDVTVERTPGGGATFVLTLARRD